MRRLAGLLLGGRIVAETANAQKWKAMLRLQGGVVEQLSWLTSHLGRLYERIDRLEKRVAAMKGAATRAKKREGK